MFGTVEKSNWGNSFLRILTGLPISHAFSTFSRHKWLTRTGICAYLSKTSNSFLFVSWFQAISCWMNFCYLIDIRDTWRSPKLCKQVSKARVKGETTTNSGCIFLTFSFNSWTCFSPTRQTNDDPHLTNLEARQCSQSHVIIFQEKNRKYFPTFWERHYRLDSMVNQRNRDQQKVLPCVVQHKHCVYFVHDE